MNLIFSSYRSLAKILNVLYRHVSPHQITMMMFVSDFLASRYKEGHTKEAKRKSDKRLALPYKGG